MLAYLAITTTLVKLAQLIRMEVVYLLGNHIVETLQVRKKTRNIGNREGGRDMFCGEYAPPKDITRCG